MDCFPFCIGVYVIKLFFVLNSAEHESVLLINLKLLTLKNSFLLNIAEHENFSANKYENAISRENFMLSWVEHEQRFLHTR